MLSLFGQCTHFLLFLWWMDIFSTALSLLLWPFFLSTLSSSQSHLNSLPKGVPACFLSSIYFILYFSASWNSLLSCPIPRHFSGFELYLDTALLGDDRYFPLSFLWCPRWLQVQDCPMPQALDLNWKGINPLSFFGYSQNSILLVVGFL